MLLVDFECALGLSGVDIYVCWQSEQLDFVLSVYSCQNVGYNVVMLKCRYPAQKIFLIDT